MSNELGPLLHPEHYVPTINMGKWLLAIRKVFLNYKTGNDTKLNAKINSK